MPVLRLVTYNVHRCIGTDGRDSTRAVAAGIRDLAPDVVALQELDAPLDELDKLDENDAPDPGGGPDSGVDHARTIAGELGMELLFCRTLRRDRGHYGHALLSRFPLELRRSATLPELPLPGSEPRGAIWATAHLGGASLEIISTHLGVRRAERALQSRVLLGPEWLGAARLRGPCVLCGDFNAVPGARTYRRFARVLTDVQGALDGHSPRPTFPSRFPVARIDHVFVTDDIRPRGARVPRTAPFRVASDHLPLQTDLEIPPHGAFPL